MNANPAGNTVISDAQETSDASNGEFERFEAVLSGLVHVPKKGLAKKPDDDATNDQ
jgi:hypothetical protein